MAFFEIDIYIESKQKPKSSFFFLRWERINPQASHVIYRRTKIAIQCFQMVLDLKGAPLTTRETITKLLLNYHLGIIATAAHGNITYKKTISWTYGSWNRIRQEPIPHHSLYAHIKLRKYPWIMGIRHVDLDKFCMEPRSTTYCAVRIS